MPATADYSTGQRAAEAAASLPWRTAPEPRPRSCEVPALRPDPLWPHGLRFLLVSHNTKFGAAKGAVLLAEALRREGYL